MDPSMASSDKEEISPPHKRSTWEIVDGGEEDVRTSGTEREDEGSKIIYNIIYDEEEDEDPDAEHSSDDYDTELSSDDDSEDDITWELVWSIWRRYMGQGEAIDEASDEQAECCAICHEQLPDEVGMPECCDHAFCLDCIQEWAKVTNKCPLDKYSFSLILVREGDRVVGTVPAPAPRKAKRKEEEEEEEEEEDLTKCEECGRNGREGRMLRCAACDLGYHCECLRPPLHSEPAEEWYCRYCKRW